MKVSNRLADWPVATLTAGTLGLLTVPWGYVALGALSHFSDVFAWVVVPPLALATGLLLWRLLGSRERRPTGNAGKGVEALCWLVVGVSLVLLSGLGLQTVFERIGLSCLLWLSGSLLWLPGAVLRLSALRGRFERWSRAGARLVVLAALLSSAGVALAWLLAEPAFL